MHSFWLAQVSQSLLNKMLDQLRDGGSTITLLTQDDPLCQIYARSVPAAESIYHVEGSGIIATVAYDPNNQRALVVILSKPFLAPVSYIESEVRKSLRAARG